MEIHSPSPLSAHKPTHVCHSCPAGGPVLFLAGWKVLTYLCKCEGLQRKLLSGPSSRPSGCGMMDGTGKGPSFFLEIPHSKGNSEPIWLRLI